jgi:hypothetical protein
MKKAILILMLLAPFAISFLAGVMFERWIKKPKIEINKEKNKDVVLFLESIKNDILDIGALEVQKSIELEESSQLIANGALAKHFNLQNLKIAGTDKKFSISITAIGKLGFSDFKVDKTMTKKDTSTVVTFPKPKLLSMEVKHLKFESENALWLNDVSDSERAALFNKAQEQLRQKILKESINHLQAKANVRNFIKKIFEFSNDSVSVRFDEFNYKETLNQQAEEKLSE